jgi:hypothetical protein
MKIITEYQCEICHKKHAIASLAMACEAQGFFDSSKYPIGLMFPYYHNGYTGIFSIANYERTYICNAHMGSSTYWAARANERIGDSLDTETCGGSFLRSDDVNFKQWVSIYHMRQWHIGNKEYVRMATWLTSKGFRPCYYTIKNALIYIS